MRYSTHSHANGASVLPKQGHDEIVAAITAISTRPGAGKSAAIREEFLTELASFGWAMKVRVGRQSKIDITALHHGIGLCLQTGNVARSYADMLKLQTLFSDNSISAGALVVPSHGMSKLLGSNVANAARMRRELAMFEKAFLVPTVVYSLELT